MRLIITNQPILSLELLITYFICLFHARCAVFHALKEQIVFDDIRFPCQCHANNPLKLLIISRKVSSNKKSLNVKIRKKSQRQNSGFNFMFNCFIVMQDGHIICGDT
jgi:hypothetical protein